ncbi:MAG: NAD(P)H-dependent oxidoreductase subunit E [Bacteroidota bacterium]|jgi:NADH-quinone oxidoreductase E subunit
MEISFSPEEIEQIEKIKTLYPNTKAAVLPVLWLSQRKFGWISDDVKNLVSDLLELPVSHVHGVVSFYTMYFKKPMGKYHVQVCTNVSCMLNGGEKIYEYIKDRLKIDNLQATNDGIFSLEEVECMGACGGAPMIAINQDFYENTNIEKLDTLLDSLK